MWSSSQLIHDMQSVVTSGDEEHFTPSCYYVFKVSHWLSYCFIIGAPF